MVRLRLEDRFWAKVDKQGPKFIRSKCWVWTAGTSEGYGVIGVGPHRTALAHRVSWLLAYGEWPSKMCLHRCDNRACVRPSHLFVGTRADNVADAVSKARHGHGRMYRTAKLSPQVIRDIRKAYARGISQYAIADRYGVAQSNVSRVINGRRWVCAMGEGKQNPR